MFKNMTALFIALVIAILFSAPAAAAEKPKEDKKAPEDEI